MPRRAARRDTLQLIQGSGPGARRQRGRLPRQLTSFVGRTQELTDVVTALGQHRLVTVCGPGGAGKTRLALAAAERLQDQYPDGIFVVELADVHDAPLVASSVAATLDVRERAETGIVRALVDALSPSQTLIVLDDCDHVVEACAELAMGLLHGCPRVRLLASSREPLGMPGEIAWRLPALGVPEPEDDDDPTRLSRHDSVRLFVQRAQEFQPGFRLTRTNAAAVARICERTEGIPLAIELAAGRLTILSADQIADQMNDALTVLASGQRMLPSRQRTLRASIAGSYERLSARERLLFDRLSVFSGLASLDDVRAVCADERLTVAGVLDDLARLIDKSLVQAEAASRELRYRQLDLLRQYASEQLVETGEAELVRGRHAAHFVAMAEASNREQARTEYRVWTQRLTEERANFRAALDWSLREDPELALRLAASLSWFWHRLSNLAEGRRWLERALSLPGGDPAIRAQALRGLGHIVYRQGDCEAAQAFLTEALTLSRQLGHDATASRVLRTLGLVVLSLGDFARAERCLEEALVIQQRLGDPLEQARTLGSLGLVATATRRYDVARQRLEASTRLARESGDEWTLATSIGCQGELFVEVGDHANARSQLRASISVLSRLDDSVSIAYRLEGFAQLAALRGQPERALTLAAAAAGLRQRIGAGAPPHWRERVREAVGRCRRALPERLVEAAEARGTGLGLEDMVAYALDDGEGASSRGLRESAAPPWASTRAREAGLSAREWDVLALLLTGPSNRVIASRLSISPNTVNKHVASILDKLAARSRSQAIAIVLGLEHVE